MGSVGRVATFALLVCSWPAESRAGCDVCSMTAPNCSPGYSCEYDEAWGQACCHGDAGPGGPTGPTGPVCEIQTCESFNDCQRLGSAYTCVDGCCDARCVHGELACNSSLECGGGGCDGGCCEGGGPVCAVPCESLLGCRDLGASWVCDTAAHCCVDLSGDAGGRPIGDVGFEDWGPSCSVCRSNEECAVFGEGARCNLDTYCCQGSGVPIGGDGADVGGGQPGRDATGTGARRYSGNGDRDNPGCDCAEAGAPVSAVAPVPSAVLAWLGFAYLLARRRRR